MIPPNNYLTFHHKFLGSISYKGTKNFDELYRDFLINPSLNKCDSFSNKLSDIQLKVLNEAFCIIFVLPTIRAGKDIWKPYRSDLDKLMNFIKTIVTDDQLIVAWDVFFKKVDDKLKSAYSVIGIEHIMDVPFNNKNVMVPGNIFISCNGKIIGNGLNVDDCIDLFSTVYEV